MLKRQFYVTYSVVCYIIFAVVFAYFIGFVGDFGVDKTIDRGDEASLAQSLIVNLALILLFGVQHSVMARPAFKAWWTKTVPKPIERSTYVLFTSIALVVLCVFWHPLPDTIWDFQNEGVRTLLYGGYFLGIAIVIISTFLINHFDLLGLRQVYFTYRQIPYAHVPFVVRGFYRWSRHPLMLGFIIMFWVIPTMTVGHLLFAVSMTVYIMIGIHYEERDTRQALGAIYLEYHARTPKIIGIPEPTQQTIEDIPASVVRE